jgi:hypothetical protein
LTSTPAGRSKHDRDPRGPSILPLMQGRLGCDGQTGQQESTSLRHVLLRCGSMAGTHPLAEPRRHFRDCPCSHHLPKPRAQAASVMSAVPRVVPSVGELCVATSAGMRSGASLNSIATMSRCRKQLRAPVGVGDQTALEAGRSNFNVALGDVRTRRATAVSRCSLQRDAGGVNGLIAKTHPASDMEPFEVAQLNGFFSRPPRRRSVLDEVPLLRFHPLTICGSSVKHAFR